MSGESIKESLTSAIENSDYGIDSIEPLNEPQANEDLGDEGFSEESGSAQKTSTPRRDASGRFVKNAKPSQDEVEDDTTTLVESTQEEEPEDATVEAQPDEKPVPPIPSGFGKHRDLWQKLHDSSEFTADDKRAVLDFYKQREGEMLRGISHYKEQAEKSHYLSKAIESYVPELLKEGIDPANFVSNLAKAHFTLTKGSPEEKAQTFQYLMQSYGVQLNPQSGGFEQMNPHLQSMMDNLRKVESRLQGFETERLQNQEQQIQSEIQALQSDVTNFPHFEEAREDMARLLEQGHATTFEQAYKLALRLNDDLWSREQERLLAQHQQPSAQSKQAQLLKAKKANVSVSNQAPSAGASNSSQARTANRPYRNSRESIVDSLRNAMGSA